MRPVSRGRTRGPRPAWRGAAGSPMHLHRVSAGLCRARIQFCRLGELACVHALGMASGPRIPRKRGNCEYVLPIHRVTPRLFFHRSTLLIGAALLLLQSAESRRFSIRMRCYSRGLATLAASADPELRPPNDFLRWLVRSALETSTSGILTITSIVHALPSGWS